MKYLAAALVFGLALSTAPASATACYGCVKCAPVRTYDSQQVIRSHKTVNRSRVINTTSIIYRRKFVASRPKVVTRVHAPVTVVNMVVHNYRITHRPHPDAATRVVYPVAPRCKYGVSRSGSCVLRVRG